MNFAFTVQVKLKINSMQILSFIRLTRVVPDIGPLNGVGVCVYIL